MQYLDRVVPFRDVCRLSFSSCPDCGSKKLTRRGHSLEDSSNDRMVSNRCLDCRLWWAAARGDYVFEEDGNLLDLFDPHKPAKDFWLLSFARPGHPGRLVAHRREMIYNENGGMK